MGHPLHRNDDAAHEASVHDDVDRELALSAAFAELADTSAPDYDVAGHGQLLVAWCVSLLDTAAASLLLIDDGPKGLPHVLATAPEPVGRSDLWELQVGEGPGAECLESGEPVAAPTLAAIPHRWPKLGPRALAAGFASIHALPLQVRSETIGALSLFGRTPGQLRPEILHVARALAKVTAHSIQTERDLRRGQTLTEQLQTALDSRVLIEQAKGVLAERGELDVDDAFERMRGHARRGGRRLNDVAREIVDRTLDTDPLLGIDKGAPAVQNPPC